MTRVLVVDDDVDIRSALSICLVSEGYGVEACEDGQVAIDRLQAGLLPDAIVLDLMMPRLNGFDLLKRLHADPRWAAIPVVVISANRGYSAEDLGVRSILRKPFELEDLVGALDAASKAA